MKCKIESTKIKLESVKLVSNKITFQLTPQMMSSFLIQAILGLF